MRKKSQQHLEPVEIRSSADVERQPYKSGKPFRCDFTGTEQPRCSVPVK